MYPPPDPIAHFIVHNYQYLETIRKSIEDKSVGATLVLIYSGIDSMAWIAYGDTDVGERYIKWIENFMYKEKLLDATPVDLYAARCAILHTQTPDSRLSNKGQARVINYAWGKASLDELKISQERIGYDNSCCIHLNDLFEFYKNGTADFMETIKENSEAYNRIRKRYVQLGMDVVKDFNLLK